MSEPATLRAPVRKKHPEDCLCDKCVEFFPTPMDLCTAICKKISPLPNIKSILEPSAGTGNFIRAARATWPESKVCGVEFRDVPRPPEANGGWQICRLEDFISTFSAGGENSLGDHMAEFDLVLGNPPFSHAEAHARRLLAAMKEGAHLAFLLKLAFYESDERLDFWKTWPEKFFAPIVPRPGFGVNKQGKPGTDSQAYGLFIWQKGFVGKPTRLSHLVWEKPVMERKPRGKPRLVLPDPTPVPSGAVEDF